MVEADKMQTIKSQLQSAQKRRAADLEGTLSATPTQVFTTLTNENSATLIEGTSKSTPQPDRQLDKEYDSEVIKKELEMMK